ncbi:MAG: hypothetical protein LBH01_09040 [Verrucomicrobiales bacterium]|jgi:erythromycin esterase-like protein|nr:hypothetical protein [Verrucomicrobiales bacterium]
MGKVCFLGEAIHGVAEFTTYKHDWLRNQRPEEWIIVFEADHIGMLNSVANDEPAYQILQNFPKVHRTQEMLMLLEYLIEKKIPYYGADVVTRNKIAKFHGDMLVPRQIQAEQEGLFYSQADPFTLRDSYMAKVIANVASNHPHKNIAGFFHNGHIKKHGSKEIGKFKLRDTAEVLFADHQIPSYSTGLFAAQGNMLHNIFTPRNFNNIADTEVIESLAKPDSSPLIIKDKETMGNLAAYHHAFEKENLPVAWQYDECVIFHTATTPTLVKEAL